MNVVGNGMNERDGDIGNGKLKRYHAYILLPSEPGSRFSRLGAREFHGSGLASIDVPFQFGPSVRTAA
jgi:hypothetical protein